MATLVLGAVGSAVGGALIPGGVLGTAITGATIGGAVGAVAGGFIDQALLGPLATPSGQTRLVQGPRLSDLQLGASSEGVPLPRVYGRARLPGQLIWATRFKEEVTVTTQTTGGGQVKGGKNLFELAEPFCADTDPDRADDRVQLLRQCGLCDLRRPDHAGRAHLGGRQGARSSRTSRSGSISAARRKDWMG